MSTDDLYAVMTEEELADPLYGAFIDALVALNRADAALTAAVYGPSNGSRTDTTHLQNARDEAQDVAREAYLDWKRPR